VHIQKQEGYGNVSVLAHLGIVLMLQLRARAIQESGLMMKMIFNRKPVIHFGNRDLGKAGNQ
jgi:hypothetical protein